MSRIQNSRVPRLIWDFQSSMFMYCTSCSYIVPHSISYVNSISEKYDTGAFPQSTYIDPYPYTARGGIPEFGIPPLCAQHVKIKNPRIPAWHKTCRFGFQRWLTVYSESSPKIRSSTSKPIKLCLYMFVSHLLYRFHFSFYPYYSSEMPKSQVNIL